MAQDPKEILAALAQRHGALASMTHYEVLGVEPGADAEVIRKAFRVLARDHHVDRFNNLGITEEQSAQLQVFFSRINEANQTLSDKDARDRYDGMLRGEIDLDEGISADDLSRIFEADAAFRKGKTLLERGQFQAAAKSFSFALEVNPEDVETQLYSAFTEFVSLPLEDGSRSLPAMQIFERIEALAKKDENKERVSVHLYYAKALKLLNRDSKALAAFEKVRALEPRNVEAGREIRLIKSRAKKPEEKGGGFLGKIKGLFKKK